MAYYYCVVRTNYFHVKDSEKFEKLMNSAYGSEDEVDIWREKDDQGNLVFGFGVYGGIAGIFNDDEDPEDADDPLDNFLHGLQNCVAEDDAVIIFEIGHENLRYLVGNAIVITSKKIEYCDISEWAQAKGAELLGNQNWETRCEY